MASFNSLRGFVRPREAGERCDICGSHLPVEHCHQFDPATRGIRCACPLCLALPDENWREIPRRIVPLPDFRLSDAAWEDLMIPIALAFFFFSTPAGKLIALYPGPAGATESLVRLEAWREIASGNPELLLMQPDVEALLVNRVGAVREYFIAPIDECYKLVGTIRLHWRGLAGGAEVWGHIARFFDELRRKGARA